MSLGVLFYPITDEYFYSYLVRYHKYSGNQTVAESKDDLFGYPKKTISFHFPANLLKIGKVLSQETEGEIDEEYIMKELLLVSFTKPFIRQEAYSKVVNGLLESTTDVYKYSGLISGGLFKENYKRIKICPICFKNDTELYGEGIIRRSHNIPGVRVCKYHGCFLDEYDFTTEDFYNLTDINNVYREKIISYPDKKIKKYYLELNRDIDFILSGGLDHESYDSLVMKLKEKMKFSGSYKTGIRIKGGLFKKIFQSYPIPFLESLGLDNERLEKNHWFRQVVIESDRPIHYVPFLLIVRFFFEDLGELVNFNDEYEPFGVAPYPCVNPFCSCYGEQTINNYEILNHKTNGRIVASFECEKCRMKYTRVESESNENKFVVSKIIYRGPIWLKALENEFSSKRYTQEELTKIFDISRTTIRKYYKTFRISGSLEDYLAPRKSNPIISIDERKRRCSEFIDNNPNCTRTEIYTSMRKDISALRRYDPEWIKNRLPEKQRSGYELLWQKKSKKRR